MKALIYYAYDDIRLEDLPVPACGEDEIVIRVRGCGLCSSDIGKIIGRASAPVKLGHELTGTIVECGQLVKHLKVGQRVVVAHHVSCGTCHYCRHRNDSMCATFQTSNIDPCGLAEYVRVPASHVRATTLLLPEHLGDEEGSFVEPLACCVRAVQRTPLLDGDSVAVMGLGSIGMLMVQALKSLAARAGKSVYVFGIDLLPARLEMARELGADATCNALRGEQGMRRIVDEQTDGRGVDAVIVTAPGEQALRAALACVRRGGQLTLFAAHAGAMPLDLETLYQQELTVSSTYSSSPAILPLALDLLSTRQVRVESLISHRLPLERFAEGVELMRGHVALKVYFALDKGNNA